MASSASACSGGPEHDEPTHRRLFLLSELNTHYLNMHLRRIRHSIHVRLVRISLHLNLLTTTQCITLGDGIIWNASSHRAPLTASLSFSPTNPASTDAFAQDILVKLNKFQQQPWTTKWSCVMTFLVDERVIAHYYAQYPLVNQESHCTASFRSSWLLLKFVQLFPEMARTKQTPRKDDVQKQKKKREPSKWGTAGQVGFHRPPHSHQEMFQEIHRTKVWMYLIHVFMYLCI